MQKQRMPRQIATAAVEGAKKGGTPHEMWRGLVEEDL
jgi:hypothetical protein